MALMETAKEAVWMLDLLMELGLCNDASYVPIKEDNQGAMALTRNPEFHARTKHIDIRYHYIREVESSGRITIHYVPTDKMAADSLTKPLTAVKFKRFIDLIGLHKDTREDEQME